MSFNRDSVAIAIPGYSVGLSDQKLSHSRRKLLDLINRLYSTGVQLELDLPVIAVIGSQSVGKSSLIESISGISLPRASGTCTRCPTECRLLGSDPDEPWECIVSLRFTKDVQGRPIPTRELQFGTPIYQRLEVEDRLKRAQLAILNPSIEPHRFLSNERLSIDSDDPRTWQKRFSSNCVSLKIRGPGIADLSFVDLPGLISSVDDEGDPSDINVIRNLVSEYIAKPSCLILLTVACETEYVNQGAHQLAKVHDPEGKRTIGVLTKPDRIPRSEEGRWIRIIRNESHPLFYGWYCVKNPDSAELYSRISWHEARARGEEFFLKTEPWASLPYSSRQRLGTAKLTQKLSEILYERIKKRLPDLQQEIARLLQVTESNLRDLPASPRSKDPVKELLNVIAEFVREISLHIQGIPPRSALVNAVRASYDDFKAKIRQTAPEFRPYERIYERTVRVIETPLPGFLIEEGWEVPLVAETSGPVYHIGEIMERRRAALTWELPDNSPFFVSKELISETVKKWNTPAVELFNNVEATMTTNLKNLIKVHFDRHHQSGLQATVSSVVTQQLRQCREKAWTHLLWLLELEEQPFTTNTHDFTEYKEKFYQFYKSSRHSWKRESTRDFITYPTDLSVAKGPQLSLLDAPAMVNGNDYRNSQTFETSQTYTNARERVDPALAIMAEVRAYFQVAHKRFVDNVASAINHDLLLGFDRDLHSALHESLGIHSDGAFIRSKELITETLEVVALREELEAKRQRLELAKQEIGDIWF